MHRHTHRTVFLLHSAADVIRQYGSVYFLPERRQHSGNSRLFGIGRSREHCTCVLTPEEIGRVKAQKKKKFRLVVGNMDRIYRCLRLSVRWISWPVAATLWHQIRHQISHLFLKYKFIAAERWNISNFTRSWADFWNHQNETVADRKLTIHSIQNEIRTYSLLRTSSELILGYLCEFTTIYKVLGASGEHLKLFSILNEVHKMKMTPMMIADNLKVCCRLYDGNGNIDFAICNLPRDHGLNL